MKNYLFIVILCILGIGTLLAQSYRGNLVETPEPIGGFLLRSGTEGTFPRHVKANWRYNLGLGEAGILVNSGTPATTQAGTVVMTGSSMNVYLTGSTGLMIVSGTVTTF